jgi:peptidoglycan/LPS O-acetylase OafA/YrhL
MRVESMDGAMPQGGDRLPGIDVLRGVAAILVVLHHIHIRFRFHGYEMPPYLPEGVSTLMFWTGYYAVVCFFVISGFLITRLSLRRWSSPQQLSPAAFYGLRAARILPCLLLVLAMSSLLHLLGVDSFVIRPERASLGRALFAALGFHVNWYEGRHGYLPGNWDVMWSLSVEETFYLLFPLACLALRSRAAMLLGLLPLIVIAPFNRVWLGDIEPWDEYSYLSCMDGIAMGCIAGWLSERRSLDRFRARLAMGAGVTAVLLIVVFRKTTVALGLVATGTHITVLEFGMALLLLAMASGVGNTLFARGTSLLRAVGRCSYEIYLTHMFIVLGFFIAFRAFFGKHVLHPAFYPACYALVLILSMLLGYAVSRWFSEPVNRGLRAWLGPQMRLNPAACVRIGPVLEPSAHRQ